MNSNKAIDYNSLGWVKPQLDDVLSDAQSNLNEYIESKTDEDLENCIEHLQLIYGTLQMVEIYGASMLAEEIRFTAKALLERNVESVNDTYDILMRALIQLPDYLENIQAGSVDTPMTLMPLINDLRAARNEGLLTEGALFSPDIENAKLLTSDYDATTIEPGKLQAEIKRLRMHYQVGLLDCIRNNKERAGLQRIKAVLKSLEKVTSDVQVRHMWMIACALVESLVEKGVDNNLSIKMLLSAIDRQLKVALDVGEAEFANQYSKELVKNVLYYVGLSSTESVLVSAVKDAYKLADLLPQESDGSNVLSGGLNAELFATVSKSITDDLSQVKDILELFMHSSERNIEQLSPVVAQLGKIADTYGMLGLGSTRQSIMHQRIVLQDIVNGKVDVSEQLVLDIASSLLNAESELNDYIAQRTGHVDINYGVEDQMVPAAEYRQVVFTVVSEALKNFTEAKEAILSYVSGAEEEGQLDIIINRLEEVRGVAMMLPLDQVESQIVKLQSYVRIALLNNNHEVTAEEQDAVADVVSSIEYFLEALSDGRSGLNKGLKSGLVVGDLAADKLECITQSFGVVKRTLKVVDEVKLKTDDNVGLSVEQNESNQNQQDVDCVETEILVPQSVATDMASIADGVESFTIIANDADEEIVEIFIEEALEVLGELQEYYPQWKDNSENDEALTVLRRCFHTLKGSGRLLGAELIGEFSWKFENLLNRILEKRVVVSEAINLALEEALCLLPQLIEQLKGMRDPITNIGQLMSAVDALADGRNDVLCSLDTVDANSGDVNPVSESSVEPVSIHTVVFEQEDYNAALSEDDSHSIDIITDNTDAELDSIETVDGVADGNLDFVDTKIESTSLTGVEIVDDVAQNVTETILVEGGTDVTTNDDTVVECSGEEDNSEIVDDSLNATDISEVDIEADVAVTEEAKIVDGFDQLSAHELTDILDDSVSIDNIDGIGKDLTMDDCILSHKSDVELPDALVEEVIFLDSEDLLEDDFDIELEVEGEAGCDGLNEKKSVSENHIKNDEADSSELLFDEVDVDEDSEEGSNQKDDLGLSAGTKLDIDPMLLQIYGDESLAHLNEIRKRFVECEADGQLLKADKNLIRSFHTLYGSARTAEVESIADLTGTTEKYIKACRDNGVNDIPDEVTVVLREVEQSISSMLDVVMGGYEPPCDKTLHDKISIIYQREIQALLQNSTQESSTPSQEGGSVNEEALLENDAQISSLNEAVSVDEATENREEPEVHAEQGESIYGHIDDELLEIFLEEAGELLEDCEGILYKIKSKAQSTENIQKLQRNMHTLKGGARMANLTFVGDLTHNLESLVVKVNDSKENVNEMWPDLVQESLDVLTTMLVAVRKRKPLVFDNDLNDRIEQIVSGEIEGKHSMERFDVEFNELGSADDESHNGTDNNKTTFKETCRLSNPQITDDAPQQQQERGSGSIEGNTGVNVKASFEQVRVSSDLLNNLVDYAGEVNIFHARMGKQLSDFGFNLAELTQTVVRLKEQLRKLEMETEIQIRSGYEKESGAFDDSFDPLELDQFSNLQQLTRSLSETAADVDSINETLIDISRDSETLLLQESRISTDLQEGLMRTRMVRFGGLSSRLRRVVRQAARELGKKAELVLDGEGSEVDRTVLDRIIAPLEHMLRNAVVHGIEMPEERKCLGKKETGLITIEVGRQAANVVIKVIDDGKGIDAHKVRQTAIKSGLLPVGTDVSDRDALQLILHSGFSTSDNVTQLAGRGVGMDVVDSEIKQLGGVFEIDTVRGQGSEFTLRLPLTLAINQALLVSTADDVYAVPLASIEGVVRITGFELQRFYDSNNSHYAFNGVEYELKHLGSMLTGNRTDYSKQLQLFPVLLVHVGDQHFALHVDDLIGRREIVIKPVGAQIASVHGIAGATILADGRVVLILEMSALIVENGLFKMHTSLTEDNQAGVVDDVITVMVVDDSITIRKITERMLKRHGMKVVLAKDGIDATNLLQDQVPDLMLLDIEMPRMDGFEVASFVRSDERLKDLPIIMITSRTGSKHKEKAMLIGVDCYLGKPFQEEELVKNINALINVSSCSA